MRKLAGLHRTMVALVVVGGLLLSACATTRARHSWNGHPIAEAMAKWGIPVIEPAQVADGTTVYHWLWSPSYTYDQQVGYATTDYGTVDFYEKQVGRGACGLSINADSSGTITNLETSQNVRQCGDIFWASGVSPDETTAINGKALASNLRSIRAIDQRYRMACARPEYAKLFDQSRCNVGMTSVAVTVRILEITPQERATFASWLHEMGEITGNYLAFFRSTGAPQDMQIVQIVESMPDWSMPDARAPGGFADVQRVGSAARKLSLLVQHSIRTYHQFNR